MRWQIRLHVTSIARHPGELEYLGTPEESLPAWPDRRLGISSISRLTNPQINEHQRPPTPCLLITFISGESHAHCVDHITPRSWSTSLAFETLKHVLGEIEISIRVFTLRSVFRFS